MEGLNTTILRECVVPLPSLVKQKLIVDLLMEADRVRRARRYTLELSETLLTDYFLSTFKEYLMQGPSTSLKEVLSQPLSNGFFKKKEAYGNGNGVPVIWVDNLYETITIDLTKLRRAEVSYEERKKYEVAEGDLLFTRSSLVRTGIGQINIVPVLKEPILFECHIIRARVERNKVNPFYLLGLYRSRFGKELILKRANTATMTTISQEALEELPCPLPPFRLQNQFEGLVRKVQYLQCMQREALRQGEHLFKTFLYQSFSGK
jgi:type I restriction enzyme S subunit